MTEDEKVAANFSISMPIVTRSASQRLMYTDTRLQQIGNEQKNYLNEAIAEPLPDKFRGLLRALEGEISRKNDPFA